MTRAARFLISACLMCVPALAQTWSGYLVDSKCYAALERNTSPTNTLRDVNTDRGSEVRYCRPTRKTTSFAVVDFNGQSFNLDATGNVKAAALPKARVLYVTVTGKLNKRTVNVNSIALAK